MATYDAGVVTAYGSAVQGGYTGTYEQFCTQQANYAASAAAVEQAKQDAEAAAEDARESAQSARGLTEDIKQALLQIAEKVAYIDEDGQDYYDDLYDALYPPVPPAELVSISAVYTQSGTVYNTDTLDSLKSDLVVTALYDDQTTATITEYTLSGTLTEGTSTITVSYSNKTTTFSVTVSPHVIVTHTYANNQYNAISNPSDMILTAGMVVSGGKASTNGRVDPTAELVAGRAADTQRVLVGDFGGKTLGLSSYTLSSGATVAFACWFGTLTDLTWNGTKYISTNNNYLASAWLTSNVVLPATTSDTTVLLIAFRKGNGSVGDFTEAELAEIPSLIRIL